VWGTSLVDLHGDGSLMGDEGEGFVLWDTGVTSFAIADNGDVIMLNALGNTYEHTPGATGPDPCIGSDVTAIAIAGNGDVIQLTAAGLDFEHTPGGPVGNDPCIGSSVTSIAIAGNGDVIQFTGPNVGLVFEHTPGATGPDPCIGSSVVSFGVAGSGDVYMLNTLGNLYEHTPQGSGPDAQIGSSIVSFAVAGGSLYAVQGDNLVEWNQGVWSVVYSGVSNAQAFKPVGDSSCYLAMKNGQVLFLTKNAATDTWGGEPVDPSTITIPGGPGSPDTIDGNPVAPGSNTIPGGPGSPDTIDGNPSDPTDREWTPVVPPPQDPTPGTDDSGSSQGVNPPGLAAPAGGKGGGSTNSSGGVG
jgi:hypothetical protein